MSECSLVVSKNILSKVFQLYIEIESNQIKFIRDTVYMRNTTLRDFTYAAP